MHACMPAVVHPDPWAPIAALPHLHRRVLWHRYNELEFRWAVYTTWVLTKQFSVSDAILSAPSVELLLSRYEPHRCTCQLHCPASLDPEVTPS